MYMYDNINIKCIDSRFKVDSQFEKYI